MCKLPIDPSYPGVMRRFVTALLAPLLMLGLACWDEPRGSSGADEPGEPAVEVLDEELLGQLRAIGYVSGSVLAGPLKGVTIHEAQRTYRGLNLFTSGHAPVAILMDMAGNVLHQWRAEFEELFPDHPDAQDGVPPEMNFWRHAELLPNGDIITIWEGYGIFRLDKNSKILWARPNRAHHELSVTQGGQVYHLSHQRRFLPEIEGKKSSEDFIVVLDAADGAEVRRLSIAKALENANWPELRRAFWSRERTRDYGMSRDALYDPFHTNALWILSKDEARRLGDPFHTGDVLVSMCLLDTIAVVDMKQGVTRWWQTGPFGLQHQPRVTLGGRIVLFNNFVSNERSSVQIIDPHTREVTWEYTGPESDPLFSKTSGGVEVLPNGNLLIIETNKGRVLELTPDKDIVWEFHNPYVTGAAGSLVASVFQMDRVTESSVEWLDP